MFFILPAIQDKEPDMERLIKEYSKGLTRLCYMLLKDAHLAEDAAFEALFKAYKNFHSFRRDCSEKTWITQIAVNVCKNYMRKDSFREIAGSDRISLDYASEDMATSEFCNEEALMLLNAVYQLPEKYKQVVLLRYYQQMSVSEISKVLKEKENTISVRIRRAHEMLKKALKEV